VGSEPSSFLGCQQIELSADEENECKTMLDLSNKAQVYDLVLNYVKHVVTYLSWSNMKHKFLISQNKNK
jgi:hypothetical protein